MIMQPSNHKKTRTISSISLLILCLITLDGFVLNSANAQTNLVIDPGFEPPNPTTTPGEFQNGFVVVNVGATFGGPNNNAWTVVQAGGISGDVAITSTTEYTHSSYGKTYFNGNSGLQWLDLTGDTDNGARVGVQQVIPTVAGVEYQVGFYLGSNEGTIAASRTRSQRDITGHLHKQLAGNQHAVQRRRSRR